MLRKDIENARLSNQASIQAVQQDVDRQYDLMKFVVGTFALGFLALIAQAMAAWKKDASGGRQEAEIVSVEDGRRRRPPAGRP